MIYKYLSFAVSISFISFIVGLAVNSVLKRTKWYTSSLSHLNFINSEALNKWVGVDFVRWIILHTPVKYLNQKLSPQHGAGKRDLLALRSEMTSAEIDHLIGFLFVMFFAVAKFYSGQWLFGLTITLVNILMNLHPSLLQQQNKRRIDKILSRTARGNTAPRNQRKLRAEAVL